jgi:crotonobetainyl-CoA:carnitine CoA-transferase CaiB-like acyl-CoA transferase
VENLFKFYPGYLALTVVENFRDILIKPIIYWKGLNMQLLEGYRALDLTEGGCLLCGQLFAEMGVDVIKIEKPGGSPSRKIGPFYKDIHDPEKSLFWFAYNAGKKSITLNIETADGRDLLKKLIKTADFVIESYEPGYMESIGLNYAKLEKINPRIILTSITPFGQTGPKANYKASDLTSWAAGGMLFVSGDSDRPPVWISYPQASLQGALHASAQTMVANWYRELSGEGQQVDISIQECVLNIIEAGTQHWDIKGNILERFGGAYKSPKGAVLNTGFPCKDGFISLYLQGGDLAMLDSDKILQNWIIEEGMAPDWFKEFNWETDYDASKLTQEIVDRVEGVVKKFLMTKTKQEIFEIALKRRLLAAPANTPKDVCEDPQMESRGCWIDVEHPNINDVIVYCGPPIKLNDESVLKTGRRSPLIGEHNQKIYEYEMKIAQAELDQLKQANII